MPAFVMKISFFRYYAYEPNTKDKDAIISKLLELNNDETIEFLLIVVSGVFNKSILIRYAR